uniref:Transporter n=1 Tax=Peronospora matthiolae TaxID=2874970 RepID=A0AAV1UUY1_9STRA
MIVASAGDDDSSSAGDSSVNSGLLLHKSCERSTAARSNSRSGRVVIDIATTDLKNRELLAKFGYFGRKARVQLPKVQDACPRKEKSALTRDFSRYGSLQAELESDDSTATFDVQRLSFGMYRFKSSCRAENIKKKINSRKSAAYLKVNSSQVGSDESGDDFDTSSSTYSSSSNPSSTVKTHSSPFSVSDRLELQLLVLNQPQKTCEELPLLKSLTRSSEIDIESRSLLEEFEHDASINIKAEARKMFTLAYPVTLAYVLEFVPQLVSMTLVGHLDSPLTKQYLDGVALSTMCMNLTAIGVGFGLATAMDTLCSQAYGAGKSQNLGIYLQSGLIVLALAMIPVCAINWYTEAILLLIGQPEQVARFAGRFSRILLPGIPAMYVYEMVKKAMQAQNIVLPMVYIAVISNLVNALLGVYLTFFTSLGFDGAAIARLCSQVVLPLCFIPYFTRNPQLSAEWWPGWQPKEAIHHLSTFLRLGLPGAAMMLLEWWSFEIMAAFVGLLPRSIVAISVHSVLVNVSTFAFNFFLGISVAANVLVGNYTGSNKPLHAKTASMLGMILSVSLSAVIAVIIVATRNVIPKIFINDASSIELAGHALLVLMPYQMCDAMNAVMQGVFRGTGRLMLGAYINLFAYFVVGLPFGVYLAFWMDMGVEGMWLGLTAGIFFGCVVSLVKIYETNWTSMADAARVRTG